MQKETEAYFTVEAAMVMPIVLYVIIMILYLLFFQYNRCLLELDMGVFALRGSLAQAETDEDRAVLLRKQTTEVNKEKYIAWQFGEIQWKLEKGTLQVEQQGALEFPFTNELWSTEVNYENHILSPVSFLRYCRKLVGGKG